MPEAHAADIDRLYALPLEEFTRERDELAKRLRKEGDADAAAKVKALKKPTVAAWAVNQVHRDRPDEVRELIEVTEELHRVYAKLSSAGARERLEEAADMQRELIRSLVRCASQLLEAGGHRRATRPSERWPTPSAPRPSTRSCASNSRAAGS